MAFVETVASGGGSGELPTLTALGYVNNPGTVTYNFTDNYSHILVCYAQLSQSFSSVVYPVGSTLKQELITGSTIRLYELENVANGTSITFTSTGWGGLTVYTF